MKRKRKIWRYFFLSFLVLFSCFLASQYAQAGINTQILNSFSDEIQEWQNKGYELDEVVITDLKCLEKEYIIATFLVVDAEHWWENNILKIYVVKEDEIVPFFEKKFDYRLSNLEVRDIDDDFNNEIIVKWSGGGTSWMVNGIAIFEMRNDCIVPVKVIPPITSWDSNLIPSAYLADLDGDRICELLVVDTTFENTYISARGIKAWKVFSWENGYYQENCSSFPFFYEKRIDELKKELALEPTAPISLVFAMSLYLNYYYKGEAKEGFKEFTKFIFNEEFMASWEARRKLRKSLEPLSDIVEDLLSKYPL